MNKKGFTFVEVITVIAIMGILATASFSVYTVWQSKSNVSSGRSIVVTALSEAKSQATSGTNDMNWGVKYLTNKLVLFSGATYLARDIAHDKIFDLPQGITLNGLDEFIFYKFSGLPTSALSIDVLYGNENKQININTQGVFSN